MKAICKKLTCMFIVGFVLVGHANAADFSQRSVKNIWSSIPFYSLGDIGQYENTMAKDRDQARAIYWSQMLGYYNRVGYYAYPIYDRAEALAYLMLMFDRAHDMNKYRDVYGVDLSLEAQFKATLDDLFRKYDVREKRRKFAIVGGIVEGQVRSYLSQLESRAVNPEDAVTAFHSIDYISYGTFSHLTHNQFQLTYHMTAYQNGEVKSFIATGSLVEAVNDLAKQVFDYFQKNNYPEWQSPHKGLSWLPMPANPNRSNGYSWEEANNYCKGRGYRLPFAREMMMAEAGSEYREGGIESLTPGHAYAVADKRRADTRYMFRPGTDHFTGGPVSPIVSHGMAMSFWCVKGKAASEVKIFEEVWSLIREYQLDREVYRALHTVRFELGDFDSTSNIFFGPQLEVLRRMSSLEEALGYLETRQIDLKIPAGMH